jgi:Type III secretion needle MxiH, YscF, SsaG, EprI, PscF, EscF
MARTSFPLRWASPSIHPKRMHGATRSGLSRANRKICQESAMGMDPLKMFSEALNIASMFVPALKPIAAIFDAVTQMAGNAASAGVDQLQKEAGLPKFLADAFKDKINEVLGGTSQTGGAQGDQAAQDQSIEQSWANQFAQDAQKAKEEQDSASGSPSSGKGGWLVALAKAFGKLADKAAKDLEAMGKNLNSKNPSEMIEYQARSQEFSQMMNTFTNAIKTIGEADASTVRKS